jgi:hypothetical protein
VSERIGFRGVDGDGFTLDGFGEKSKRLRGVLVAEIE